MKLDWKQNDSDSFKKILMTISTEAEIEKKNNLLGLYNYASYIYSRLDDGKQKDMFKNIINLTENMTFNLSLVYALGEQTGYFDEIVNNTSKMSDSDKYKKIFYVSRDGHMVLNLLKDENLSLFASEIKSLINTPYENLYDMTTNEKINIAIEVADYASYVTLIIPGGGIAVQVGKTLAKTTAKKIIKQRLKTTMNKSYNYAKSQGQNYLNDNVKYTIKRNLNKKINQGVMKMDRSIFPAMAVGSAYTYVYDESEQKSLCTGEKL